MKVLIIGANGFVGRRILNTLSGKDGYMVTACSFHPDICPDESYQYIQADINDYPAIKKLFDIVSPEVVINCSALSVPDYCEKHPDEADAINMKAVAHLACCCEKAGSRFIHLSTDFVFDGKEDKLYAETDIPAPVNYYGVSKYKGELAVARECSNYAIVRVVVVYGKSLPGQHGNILQLVKKRLEAGQEIRVVSDQYRTPTYVGDVADGVERLIHHNASGIWHICGKEYVSIADMAYRVADYFNLDRSLIHPVSTKEMNETTLRPQYSGLSIEKAQNELGYSPHSLTEGMRNMA